MLTQLCSRNFEEVRLLVEFKGDGYVMYHNNSIGYKEDDGHEDEDITAETHLL